MKCCANNYFNEQCLNKKVIPKYAHMMISNTLPASRITSKKVQAIRIKEEINFFLNKSFYLYNTLGYVRKVSLIPIVVDLWEPKCSLLLCIL